MRITRFNFLLSAFSTDRHSHTDVDLPSQSLVRRVRLHSSSLRSSHSSYRNPVRDAIYGLRASRSNCLGQDGTHCKFYNAAGGSRTPEVVKIWSYTLFYG